MELGFYLKTIIVLDRCTVIYQYIDLHIGYIFLNSDNIRMQVTVFPKRLNISIKRYMKL